MSDSNRILQTVREELAEVLALEIEEITPESLFSDDLGGESLDLIEFSFRIDKRLGVRLRPHDLDFKEVAVDSAGHLTEAGFAALQNQYPFFNFEPLRGRRIQNRLSLLSVAGIASFVEHAQRQSRAGRPGATEQ